MILLAILMFCLTFYIIATQVRTYRRSKQIEGARRVLLVRHLNGTTFAGTMLIYILFCPHFYPQSRSS